MYGNDYSMESVNIVMIIYDTLGVCKRDRYSDMTQHGGVTLSHQRKLHVIFLDCSPFQRESSIIIIFIDIIKVNRFSAKQQLFRTIQCSIRYKCNAHYTQLCSLQFIC